jgi:uncharacterized protein (DUF2235 family)
MNYMFAFRETFSRPVRRIRFLGLFDTVNSVPQFENAWLQRSKFPYTARSTAKVIRHAVAIDERRAKFRHDLVGQERPHKREHHYRRRDKSWDEPQEDEDLAPDQPSIRGRKQSLAAKFNKTRSLAVRAATPPRFSHRSKSRSVSPAVNGVVNEDDYAGSVYSDMSHDSIKMLQRMNEEFFDHDSDDEEQDIQETW